MHVLDGLSKSMTSTFLPLAKGQPVATKILLNLLTAKEKKLLVSLKRENAVFLTRLIMISMKLNEEKVLCRFQISKQ